MPTKTLSGFAHTIPERAQAAAAAQGESLTQQLHAPGRSIGRVRELVATSPLFRDSTANPQQNLFQTEIPDAH